MEKKYNKKFIDNERVRVLPNSEDLEKAILGAVMSDPDAANAIFGKVKASDFYVERNKIIFEFLQDRSKSNLPCDYTAVISSITEETKDKVGGYTYLSDVAASSISGAVYEQNIYQLQKLSQLRKMIGIANEISNKAYNNEDATDVISFAQKEVYDVSSENIEKDLTQVADTTLKVVDDIAEIYSTGRRESGLSTGFNNLDEIANGGFLPGQMIVLAARPGCGKTSFAMNIVANIARKDPKKVLAVFNLEMSAEELVKKMISTFAEIDSKNVSKAYTLSNAEMSKILAVKTEIANTNVYIDDSSDVSAENIFFKARRLQTLKGRLDLVLIDHMQLISESKEAGKKGGRSRYELMTDISRLVKIMAKELKTPVLVLSQMSRNVERTDENDKDNSQQKMPKMSDLRESGAIEQDADMVMFLTPGDFMLPDETANRVPLNVFVAKNRSGESQLSLNFAWDKDLGRFTPQYNVVKKLMNVNEDQNNFKKGVSMDKVSSHIEEEQNKNDLEAGEFLEEPPAGYMSVSELMDDIKAGAGLPPEHFNDEKF